MTNLIIVTGTSVTVPSDLLTDYVRSARQSNRLLVVDKGGLASRYADQLTDLMIDPERGNWDIRADLRCVPSQAGRHKQRAVVAETMVSAAPAPERALAIRLLSEILDRVTNTPTCQVDQLKDAIRSFTVGYRKDWLLRVAGAGGPAYMIPAVALLAELAARLPSREPRIPLASLRQWYANPAGRVLFLRDTGPWSDAAPVVRGVLALAHVLSVGDHQTIDFDVPESEVVA